MKKIIAVLLAVMMVLSLAACGNQTPEAGGSAQEDAPTTVAGILYKDFKDMLAADSSLSAQAIADELLKNEIIAFSGATMPVEPGYLTGFGAAEITGFSEGVMFAPMIGSIPFIGYVFTLADGTDAAAFEQLLSDNADLRWNICTEAEEKVVGSVGNKVFFVMSPMEFEEQ